MKALINPALFALILAVSFVGQAQPDYTVTGQDANSRVLQWTTIENGVSRFHSYTELASGLNHLVNGKWVESSEEIDILSNGTAAATNGQHRAYFPGDIYQGQIQLVTPDGQLLQSRPLALAYFDGTNTVVIAELTNSVGLVSGVNQVIYPNAFTGFKVDLRYTYTKAGFEQDIIMRQQPPTPESLGLNPDTARLQAMTEFFSPPQPAIEQTELPPQAGVTLTDQTLGFGQMQMVPGRAFLLGQNAQDTGALVSKHWVQVNGRQILIEEVPVNAILEGLAALPLTSMSGSLRKNAHTASRYSKLPPRRLVKIETSKSVMLVKAGLPTKGFVLDYVTLNSGQTNYTFRGDTTYFISAPFSLAGTNTFEGGAVIKFDALHGPSITTSSPLIFKTGPYRPVIFTAKDDNSVGETISFSTGNPSGYYATTALSLSSSAAQAISGVKILFAGTAISAVNTALTLTNAQIVKCGNGILASGGTVNVVDNALFASVTTNFVMLNNDLTVIEANNVTFSGANCLLQTNDSSEIDLLSLRVPDSFPSSGVRLYLTNCILVNVTNEAGVTAAGFNGFYRAAEFGFMPVTNSLYPFQIAGAGSFYFTNGCAFTNAGTTNIDPILLATLRHTTTYPPIIFSNVTFSVPTNFSPHAQRDTDTPDLGYHYDPIDYLTENVVVNDATLTVAGGTTIACYNETGIWLEDGSAINSIGNAAVPNWFTYYLSVQEQPVLLWQTNIYLTAHNLSPTNSGGIKAAGVFQFTKFSRPAGYDWHFYDRDNYSYGSLLIKDCELWAGYNDFSGTTGIVATVENTLFARSSLFVMDTANNNYSLTFSNNLFWKMTSPSSYVYVYLTASCLWSFFDNDFDSCAITVVETSTTNGYNAYLNCSDDGRLYPYSTNDLVQTNGLAYQSGPFGDFYQPTTSPLLDMGSTTAASAGLGSYTTLTNQTPDASTVDIGLHYPLSMYDSTGVDFWTAFMFLPSDEEHLSRLSLYISSPAGASGTVNFTGSFTNGPIMIATGCGYDFLNGTYVLTNLTAQEQINWIDNGLNPTNFNYVNVNNGTNWVSFDGDSWFMFEYDSGSQQISFLYSKPGIDLNSDDYDYWSAYNPDEPNMPPSTSCAQYPVPASESFTVAAGGVTNIVLTNVVILSDDEVDAYGIHVTASAPVSVYALDYTLQGSTAFTCYPTPLLGTSYCLMSRPSFAGGQSEFAIVATADNTTVTITPSINASLGGYLWTNPIVLRQGQTYQIKTKYETNDVTGTWVTADKPIAVFAGADIAFVPDASTAAGNPLVQEQLPVDSWGTNALSMGFAGRTNGDSYRVLAVYNNTVIWTNGVMVGTNQAGGFIDLTNAGPVAFQASQPIQVTRFANGWGFDNATNATGNPVGDPCEILLLPTGHYLQTNIVVTLPNDSVAGDFSENYLNIIVSQSATNNTFLDRTNPITNFVAIGNSGYCGAQVMITNSGMHKVTGPMPVGVEVYGWGYFDAYGYFGTIVK